MKKWLSGVMMLMLCLAVCTNEVHADVIASPQLSPAGVTVVGILPIVIVVVIITWKIIQNMKKK